MPKTRTQILLEPEQYQLLKQIAETRSRIRGHRVSLSAVARELLDRALADETLRREQAQAAIAAAEACSRELAERWGRPIPWETWLEEERREREANLGSPDTPDLTRDGETYDAQSGD